MAIAVGIVNDMRLAATVLERAVTADPEIKVAWIAADGLEAVKCCAENRPDVVLMDLVMPNLDGARATQRIMRETPCPILVVTSTVQGNMDLVYEAMGHGALDVCTTPVVGDKREADDGAELRRKILSIHRLAMQRQQPAASRNKAAVSSNQEGLPLVAIGASTGGPAALEMVLSCLPADFSWPIVIAQHIDDGFVEGLGRWLSKRCGRAVEVVENRAVLSPGGIYLARSHGHLVLRQGGVIGYDAEPKESFYHPSVDMLFHSAARHAAAGTIGLLLTGMGRDGAEGLLAMRQAGLRTLAQDEATAVVYGMPAAAAALNAAQEILPLGDCGARIQTLTLESIR